jgi:hypothetical protein
MRQGGPEGRTPSIGPAGPKTSKGYPMAEDPKDFRNPKVTSGGTSDSGGIGKWIAIAVAALLALLLLAWLFGLFGNDDVDAAVVPEGDDAVVVPVD